MNKHIELNLQGISTEEELHLYLMEKFGFPDFYGKNYSALVDCLTSIPYPEDGMTKIHLDSEDEYLDVNIKGLFSVPHNVASFLLSAFADVNCRRVYFNDEPFIRIILQ